MTKYLIYVIIKIRNINTNLIEITQKLKEILNQPINEMSMAWAEPGIDKKGVCVWVEGPLSVDNQYIKYYNSNQYLDATKVARIRIDKPSYVGGIHKEKNKKKWILSKSEVDTLIKLLNSPCKKMPKYTNWQAIILTYNSDNFQIYEPITGDMSIYKDKKAEKMPKYLLPLPFDLPIPDYTQLITD